jgi:hypothetical protein
MARMTFEVAHRHDAFANGAHRLLRNRAAKPRDTFAIPLH